MEADGRNTNPAPKTILLEYSTNSTVHCVRYITTGRTLGSRIFWTCTLLTSVTALLYTLISSVSAMLRFPTTMSFHRELMNELPFPAVTVCNLNSLRRSEMDKYPGLHEALEGTWTDHPAASGDGFFSTNVSRDEVIQIQNMAHQLNDSLLKCSWLGEEQPCSQMFKTKPTDSGMCFTFNQRSPSNTEGLISQAQGEQFGLIMIMHAMEDEYVISKSSSAVGFRVALHDFEDTPIPETKSFIISPGFSTEVQITFQQVNYKARPYKAYGDKYCVDISERQLKYFRVYDTNACFLECKIDHIIERCGCRGVFDPDTVKSEFCSMADYTMCYVPLEAEFWTNRSIRQRCVCPPKCVQRSYGGKPSMAKFPSSILAKMLDKEFENATFGNGSASDLLELKLYYSEYVLETVQQNPIYTFESIVATLGGQMGAYMGVSLLSLLELGGTLISCLSAVWNKTFKKCQRVAKTKTHQEEHAK